MVMMTKIRLLVMITVQRSNQKGLKDWGVDFPKAQQLGVPMQAVMKMIQK